MIHIKAESGEAIVWPTLGFKEGTSHSPELSAEGVLNNSVAEIWVTNRD